MDDPHSQSQFWEDAIDVDDSDLPSLLRRPLRPCASAASSSLRPCSAVPGLCPTPTPTSAAAPERPPPPPPAAEASSSFRPIPGPAGAVQLALHRISAQPPRNGSHPDPICTNDLVAGMDENDDRDFALHPWLSAMRLLGPAPASPPVPIASVKSRTTTADRITQMVGVVTSCVRNGLGGVFVTLKDPTGTIGASVHHRVFVESDLGGGDISVGCVLILKQVVVFCVGRSVCYLNVTSSNVVKLISKDCGPPNEQVLPSLTARCSNRVPVVSMGIGLGESEKASSTRHVTEEEETIIGLGAERAHSTGQRAGASGRLISNLNDCTIKSRKTGEHREVGLGATQTVPLARPRAEAIPDETRGNLNFQRPMNDGNTNGSIPHNIRATAETSAFTDHCRIERMRIDPKAAERRHLVRPVSETTGEPRINLSSEMWTSNIKTGLAGVLTKFSATASTTDVPMPDPGTRDKMETELGVTDRAILKRKIIECSADDTTRSTPSNIKVTTATKETTACPAQSTSEPKNLTSEVPVVQWTDEQLLELFADY